MIIVNISRATLFSSLVLCLSACGAFVPRLVDAPPPLCQDGQVSTEAEPCVARPAPETVAETDTEAETPPAESPASPETTPDTSGNTPNTPSAPKPAQMCETPALVSAMPALSSRTTFKRCYAPGTSDAIFISVKLEDSSVSFVKPIFVFDIVKTNSDGETTSVAHHLLAGRPNAYPNFFERDLTKEDLLVGLEASVAFRFKSTAPEGKYMMVISLFKDTNAYDPRNLVGRLFYRFEIKTNP